MLSIAVLKPLKHKIGNPAAVLLSFLLSGLLHEFAITVPVNTGSGGPALYFVIQGMAVIAEKEMEKRGATILKNRLIAKLWTVFWLIVPIPLLFNHEFIKQIVWPLANLKPVW